MIKSKDVATWIYTQTTCFSDTDVVMHYFSLPVWDSRVVDDVDSIVEEGLREPNRLSLGPDWGTSILEGLRLGINGRFAGDQKHEG